MSLLRSWLWVLAWGIHYEHLLQKILGPWYSFLIGEVENGIPGRWNNLAANPDQNVAPTLFQKRKRKTKSEHRPCVRVRPWYRFHLKGEEKWRAVRTASKSQNILTRIGANLTQQKIPLGWLNASLERGHRLSLSSEKRRFWLTFLCFGVGVTPGW